MILLIITLIVVGIVGVLWGMMIMGCMFAAKRRARIMTARHLRQKDRVGRGISSAGATQIGGDHYRTKTIQPWDAMQAWMTPEQFRGFLRGNAIKYLARCDDKGGIEDIQKAAHYLEKLEETLR